ncbi:MAG: PorP/SprF family type IX secretion system membrane protein [Bacteroidia bacterium]|jgi:type IX secretion system PorP/SprF family membrane protein|nr:PorP/SprF family type IX secretion system membrane protein [Bacteroidia bacterium]
MKKSTIIILAQFLWCYSYGQDVHFTQFTSGIDWLNPAAAGALSPVTANLIYRDQWGGIGEFYQSTYASGQFRLGDAKGKKGFSAAGIMVLNDRAGTARLNTLNAGATYAYHVRLDDHQTLGAGAYVGYLQRSFTNTGLQWGSQYDGMAYNSALPGEGLVNLRRNMFDLGAGLCWTWKSSESYMTANNQRMFRLGAGAWHLAAPDIGFNGNDAAARRYSVHGDALIGISNTPLAVLPAVLFQYQQTSELMVGSLIRYTVKEASRYTNFVSSSSVAVGAYWRNRDAVAIAAQLQWSNYSLGLSYDANVSALRQSTNGRGGFEIAFRYTGGKSIGGKTPIL